MKTTKRYCKACFEEIVPGSPFTILLASPLLCDACLAKAHRIWQWERQGDMRIFFVFAYASPVKDWLYRYKALNDYELRNVFFYPFAPLVRFIFPGYLLAPLPTTSLARERRGFDHLCGMAENLGVPVIDVFAKSAGPSQKELGRRERLNVGQRISVHGGENVRGRKIILFDDVMTTGSTMEACLKAIQPYGPRRVSGLVLMKNDK